MHYTKLIWQLHFTFLLPIDAVVVVFCSEGAVAGVGVVVRLVLVVEGGRVIETGFIFLLRLQMRRCR